MARLASGMRSAPTSPPRPRPQSSPPPDADALAAAREAGLRYVSDQSPGLVRVGTGRRLTYRDAAGRPVRDVATLARIRHLAIPPAWTNVWICPLPNGHIQATGRDARGRKQYRYHPDWSAVRDGTKFERMIAFGQALPRIRRQVARDLRRPRLDRSKVLAAMVRLLEATRMRIGNEEYAQQNHSFGLSTLRNRHVRIGRGTIHFEFRGKSGRTHAIDLHDPRLAAVVRRIQELPGQEIFQYVDEEGARQKVDSADVNAYLREIAGAEFSAKDFRTWAGTVLALRALQAAPPAATQAEAKRQTRAAVEAVAAQLGNTPAVCRKCYIHPLVISDYLADRRLPPSPPASARDTTGLQADERQVLSLLRRKRPTLGEQLTASVRQRGRSRQPKGASGPRGG